MTVAMFAGGSMDEAGISTRKAHIKLCVPCQVIGMEDAATRI